MQTVVNHCVPADGRDKEQLPYGALSYETQPMFDTGLT
jgi:hypothetical protein